LCNEGIRALEFCALLLSAVMDLVPLYIGVGLFCVYNNQNTCLDDGAVVTRCNNIVSE
jgi:hypothetical protein